MHRRLSDTPTNVHRMKTTPAHRNQKKTLSDLYTHLEPVSIDEVGFE